MEQKSNVQYRAEKEYKNSREKFFLLLREIISNSIHAVLIRQNKETNFIPQLDLNITFDENQCKIELRDNGEGFTEKNRLYFEELDKIRKQKRILKLPVNLSEELVKLCDTNLLYQIYIYTSFILYNHNSE